MFIIMRNSRHYVTTAASRYKGSRLKFVARSLLYYPWTISWLRYLESKPFLRNLAANQPQLLHKLHRPYLNVKYGIRRKVRLLRSHYDFLLSRFPEKLAAGLSEGNVILARWQGRGDTRYTLELGCTHVMDKEGELLLTLNASSSQSALIRMAFSIVAGENAKDYRVQIGCLQGPSGEDGRQLLKDATRDQHGLMPKLLVIRAIYMLARLLGVKEVVGISNLGHVHNARTRRYQRIDSNYDHFWDSIGGTPLNRGLYRLPGFVPARPIEDVPSAKRAQYARRKAVEANVFSQIEETFCGYCSLEGV